MKHNYEKPQSTWYLATSSDVITASLDSAEDGFDGGIVDLNPTT